MESLAYTHLALAYEEPLSVAEISNIEAFDLLTKLSLLSLLKQQKIICKAWLYGLSLSLTFIPFSETLALHQAEHQEQVNNLASGSNSKTILESAKSSSLNGNEKTQLSIPSSKKNEPQKIVLVKGDEEKVNLTNLVDTSPSIQTASTIQPIQKTQNQVSVSNPNNQAEPKQVFSTVLAMLESPSNSNTEPEAKIGPEQQGKLRLINDTPYIGIVVLYKPGEKNPYRYAYIRPCHQRELIATYSNHWQVSFNNQEISSISKVSVKNGNFFEIKTSKLAGKENLGNSCQDGVIIQPVRNPPSIEKLREESDQLSITIDNNETTIKIQQKYANLIQLLTNSMISSIYFGDETNKTIYCQLEKILKDLESIYVKNNRSLGLDGQLLPNEQIILQRNGIKIENNKYKYSLEVAELYLKNRQIFFHQLSSEPRYNLEQTNSSGTRPSIPNAPRQRQVKINAACKVSVETGALLTSAPSTKAKYC
ncbi:hypothetical protein [Planktothrix sp.]|uniref:hypothetical protein n=1 Tax=Planktothrix sp. TaxID=3088171 RepID=UPI0038D40338